MGRAFTHIDHGAAIVGNDWLERRHSVFMGHAVELRQKLPGGYVEWLAKPGADISMALSGNPLDLMRVGIVEWSEACDSAGARLTARWTGEALVISVHTLALHEFPAMIRRIEIRNTGAQAAMISAIAVDRLALRQDGAGILTAGLRDRRESADWTTGERMAAVELKGYGRLGWVLGLEEGGRFALFSPDAEYCSVFTPGEAVLSPGQGYVSPWTFMIPYTGSPEEGALKVSGELLQLFRAWRHARPEDDQEPAS